MAIPIYTYAKPILDFLIEGLAYVSNASWYRNGCCGFRDRNFSERITQVTAALHRRTLGIELPRGWRRGEALWLKTYYPGPLTSDTQPGS